MVASIGEGETVSVLATVIAGRKAALKSLVIRPSLSLSSKRTKSNRPDVLNILAVHAIYLSIRFDPVIGGLH